MKTLKSLLMLCAGLSFCACNSDNEPQFPEGEGMVEVKIVNPSTRAAGDKINIQGPLVVTLTHANGTLTQTINIEASDLVEGVESTTKTLKFWNVVNPSKVTASINGGIVSYASININQKSGEGGNLQAEPEQIPAYGETSTFDKTANKTAKPDAENADNPNNGYKKGDESKTYTIYEAAVTMAIPVARLEVGEITAPTTGNDKTFKTLKLTGVYLDDIYETGGVYSNNVFATPSASNTNYQTPGYTSAMLKQEGADASAFNFYGGAKPIFKVYFEDAIFASGAEAGEERSGWAMITKYIDDSTDDEITAFQNGKVYRITDVTLLDKNIVGDEENSALYGVEVTVTEAQWTVVDVNAEWAQ